MQFYQSKLLNKLPTLVHCYTTKQSKNLAFHVGGIQDDVVQNHQRLAQELGYDYTKLVHMQQIHSNDVKVVSHHDNFENPPKCDAIVTNKRGIPLMVMVADCAPLLFYDTEKKTIGVAHAGRAGAFSNIVKNVIKVFQDDFDANPSDIIVSVGPSIGVCCYEVGEEIYKEAKELKFDFAINKKKNRYYLDIRQILQTQLLQEGVKKDNIEISSLCNACNTRDFYSYRVEKKTGRFAGVILLQE